MASGMVVPVAVRQIATIMQGYGLRWGFCGGWAIDLFVNRVTRPHKDVDVAVLRQDQAAIHRYLSDRGWTLEKAIDGKLLPWSEDEWLGLPVHGIWCRNAASSPDFLEILLNESDGQRFLFRRDRSIALDMGRAFVHAASGAPILAPEVVLLYKAKGGPEPGNDADFHSALPHLHAQRRQWLADALRKLHPGHPWLTRL